MALSCFCFMTWSLQEMIYLAFQSSNLIIFWHERSCYSQLFPGTSSFKYDGYYLMQAKYAPDLLSHGRLTDSAIHSTLIETNDRSTPSDGRLNDDRILYGQLIDSLTYLNATSLILHILFILFVNSCRLHILPILLLLYGFYGMSKEHYFMIFISIPIVFWDAFLFCCWFDG